MLTYTIYLLLFGALCLNQATVQLAHSSQQHCHQDQSEQSQRCIMESAVVYYFPIRGRGEAVRLALSVAGVPFSSEMADSEELKHDLSKYSFGQMPRLVIGDKDLTQTNAILRFLGRKYDLFGGSLDETTTIDILLEGVSSLRAKYLDLIYQDNLADEAKSKYWAVHGEPENISGRNGGAHLGYLEALLTGSAAGFAVGDKVSIADVQLFDIVDLHLRIFPDEIKAKYPKLVALFTRVGELPAVKAYLESPLRLPKANGNGLG